ncbi:MAG: C-GCAxxG-C-C family protein [Candidatus Bathyarchaeota archaeon]|nr:MAG: C-GCAxxG-C-C family protein [Candidatus Bathyarchaeota archaeon]
MTDETKVEKAALDKAYRLGYDYCLQYGGCAPGVFAAVMDTLGYEADPVVNEVWKASLGLIGGTGNMAIGTCGAMAGAAMAISYSFGITREELSEREKMHKVMQVADVIGEVGRKMQEVYGHIQCQEVQFQHWGKSYRFTNPEAMQEFMKLSMSDPFCKEVTGNLARWTVKKILEHNPQFSKRK